MTVPTDENLFKVVDLQASFDALDQFLPEERVRIAMQLASEFLEYAAYEMALEQSADDVSEIIHMSARLDQAAQRMAHSADLAISAQILRKN